MKLPREKILKGSKNLKLIEPLFDQAEEALRSWKPLWTPFLSAPIREEALNIFHSLIDLDCYGDGGYPGAERQRILISRTNEKEPNTKELAPIKGLLITGNFLFDRATIKDFQMALINNGASREMIGDIWLNGDRGAQLVCDAETAVLLNNQTNLIRNVKINYELQEINNLKHPLKAIPKEIKTVEASTRLDAIASAGFGLSRAKIIKKIKEGKIRLNWESIKQSSRSLVKGDKVQLEGRGSLKVISIQVTKRERWRIILLRE